jgi:hypothetical protein
MKQVKVEVKNSLPAAYLTLFPRSFLDQNLAYAKLHSKIERGDQEESDGDVLLVRRSRADAGNEAV